MYVWPRVSPSPAAHTQSSIRVGLTRGDFTPPGHVAGSGHISGGHNLGGGRVLLATSKHGQGRWHTTCNLGQSPPPCNKEFSDPKCPPC